MHFTLKDYQDEAVTKVLAKLAQAKRNYDTDGQLSSVSLSAVTGAGKTVMAAAVLEELLLGEDADPSAVVLWVTDDPSLNVQTKRRLKQASDRRLTDANLHIVDGSFDQETFARGNVYFINVQSFYPRTLLVRHTDQRTHTLWDTLRATLDDPDSTVYLILDEAHKGMRSGKDRPSIVRQLISGRPAWNEEDGGRGLSQAAIGPVPIVWGISATIERFRAAMASADTHEGRDALSPVSVDNARVQASGLLKDTLTIDYPDESGVFDLTLIGEAARAAQSSEQAWKSYTDVEHIAPVIPLMVFQVHDKPTDAEWSSWIRAIEEAWPDLASDAVAHALSGIETMTIEGRAIEKVKPEDVQALDHIRVLIVKDAVTTGWDCPRAEVLASLRPRKEATYIAQMLGRMVRTPLARRIPGSDILNTVACYLPCYDRATTGAIEASLVGGEDGIGVREIITRATGVFTRNPSLPETVFDALTSLPAYTVPRGPKKPTSVAYGLAGMLATDGLIPDPEQVLTRSLCGVIDWQRAQHEDSVNRGVEELFVAELERMTLTPGSNRGEARHEKLNASGGRDTIEAAFRRAKTAFGGDLAVAYSRRGGIENLDDEQAALAVLAGIEGVAEAVQHAAAEQVTRWLGQTHVSRVDLPQARKAAYEELEATHHEPTRSEVVEPRDREVPVETGEQDPKERTALPTLDRHLLADAHGRYPLGELNSWEQAVLAAEMTNNPVAWYRNPSRATGEALRIPYLTDAAGRDANSRYSSLQPDFLFFHARSDGSIRVDIVDPHGRHLSDMRAKLTGLAAYARDHGEHFGRIESLAQMHDGTTRALDLNVARVRDAVLNTDLGVTDLFNQYGRTYPL